MVEGEHNAEGGESVSGGWESEDGEGNQKVEGGESLGVRWGI